jgi:hypothetical protein
MARGVATHACCYSSPQDKHYGMGLGARTTGSLYARSLSAIGLWANHITPNAKIDGLKE